jgi:hypothetical protein
MATQAVKDILDAQIPKPVWALNPTHASPIGGATHSTTGTEVASDSRTAFSSQSGKFIEYGDRPRIGGTSQSLVFEGGNSRNEVEFSSDFDGWVLETSSVYKGDVVSLIYSAESNSKYIYASNASDRISTAAGTLSGGVEVATLIFEERDSSQIKFMVENTTGTPSYYVFRIKIDINGDSTLSASLDRGGFYDVSTTLITGSGPAYGNPVHRVQVVYGGNDANSAGDNRRVRVYPNGLGESGDVGVAVHHTQVEETAQPGTPIVTGSGPADRSGEDVTIWSTQPDWWNEQEMTLVIEFTPQYTRIEEKSVFFGENTYSRWGYMSAGGPPFAFKTYDGTNVVNLGDSIIAHEKNRVAIAATQDRVHLAANGQSTQGPHNGNLFTISQLDIGPLNNLSAKIHSAKFLGGIPSLGQGTTSQRARKAIESITK